jgi:hypothetical protein
MFKNISVLIVILCLMYSCQSNKTNTSTETKVLVENGEMTDIKGSRKISGIYPHLTTYAHGRVNGEYGFGSECGIGALAEWNGKLYMINYAAHQPKGSEHKLYIVDKDLNMEIFEGSIGGTPTARMVHKESNQLLIGPYVIDSVGKIRVIPYSRMEGRLNAYARHLKDPKNLVYMYDMEGMLYEVNVYTLAVNKLYQDPLPGWHGKGAYTSQGKLVVSNNGEHASEGRTTHDTDDWKNEDYKWEDSWKVTEEGIFGPENLGILAEYDGADFKVVERKQYTDITTKNGVYAIPNDNSPLWAMGWDKKSVRLKMMDNGVWTTYLLPKATYNNDPPHGWFTEWPRIRSIGNGKMMMDMHGMFYDFPASFSAANTAGIKPIGSHLRYIPDFIYWNGQLVLATDETSIQGNPLAGQPQSNLWFGNHEELSAWGPASGYGAIWLKEEVSVNTPSDPYLMAGFDNRIIHLKNYGNEPITIKIEVDKSGDGSWLEYKSVKLDKEQYDYHVFDKGLKVEWVRLVSDKASQITAAFHFTDSNLNDGSDGLKRFAPLADVDFDGSVNHAKMYSNKTNLNLSVFAGDILNDSFHPKTDYEFTKFDFEFVEGIKDATARQALSIEHIGKEVGFDNEKLENNLSQSSSDSPVWFEDDASMVLNAKEYRLRLPKGKMNYQERMPNGTARFRREVQSERELANVGGTFYELPLFKVGQEPLYKMMRPVATHNKQITDFNTWNGLLVLSGVKQGEINSEHIYTSEDGKASLWFGGIDDLWSFGKPIGQGGPWKDASIKANEMSDRYLMTGYDSKTLRLKSDTDVVVTLIIYINHYLEEPVEYKTFNLKAGEETVHVFPKGFSAHWAQLKSDADCIATAWFVYE